MTGELTLRGLVLPVSGTARFPVIKEAYPMEKVVSLTQVMLGTSTKLFLSKMMTLTHDPLPIMSYIVLVTVEQNSRCPLAGYLSPIVVLLHTLSAIMTVCISA